MRKKKRRRDKPDAGQADADQADQADADQADQPDADQADADKAAADKAAADKAKKSGSRLVRVEVRQSIAFAGVAIHPKIDDSGRTKGQKPIITPVKAVIPRSVAECHSADAVKILGEAPKDAKVGVIE